MAATALLFLALGGASTPRRTLPEIRFVAGWGVACLVFTLWGVLTPWSLQWPAGGLAITGLLWLVRAGWRERLRGWQGLGRILLLTSPLWLLMLSVWPSQIDTWLNLLPNAAYLFDHDRLPTAALPANYSFLPVAPYNTQFANYLGSLAVGQLRRRWDEPVQRRAAVRRGVAGRPRTCRRLSARHPGGPAPLPCC